MLKTRTVSLGILIILGLGLLLSGCGSTSPTAPTSTSVKAATTTSTANPSSPGATAATSSSGSSSPTLTTPQPTANPMTTSQGATMTKVEIDIFSGRPNPTWNIPNRETASLKEIVEKIAKQPAILDYTIQLPTDLGFRGFVLTSNELKPNFIKVYRDIVQFGKGKGRVLRVDPDKELQTWLLANAKTHLDPSLYKQIEKQINRQL